MEDVPPCNPDHMVSASARNRVTIVVIRSSSWTKAVVLGSVTAISTIMKNSFGRSQISSSGVQPNQGAQLYLPMQWRCISPLQVSYKEEGITGMWVVASPRTWVDVEYCC